MMKPFYVLHIESRLPSAAHKDIKAMWERALGPDAPPLIVVDGGAKLTRGDVLETLSPSTGVDDAFADLAVAILSIGDRQQRAVAVASVLRRIHESDLVGKPVSTLASQGTCDHACGHTYLTDDGNGGMVCSSCKIKLQWTGTEYKPA